MIGKTDLAVAMPTSCIRKENVFFHQTNSKMDKSSYVPNFDMVMTFIWIIIVST